MSLIIPHFSESEEGVTISVTRKNRQMSEKVAQK